MKRRTPLVAGAQVVPVSSSPAAPAATQQAVRDLFTTPSVEGVASAPGTASLVGRGEDVRRGVASTITTRVVVDPVWGPPADFGPQIDVLVS